MNSADRTHNKICFYCLTASVRANLVTVWGCSEKRMNSVKASSASAWAPQLG